MRPVPPGPNPFHGPFPAPLTPPFPGMFNINEEEEIDPQAYYTSVDQIWDQFTQSNWLTRKLKRPDPQASANSRMIFKAYKRAYGAFGPSIDDHTWIDLKSQALIGLLRSEPSLKGAGNLLQNQPGIDAREIFLRLSKLKELAVEPVVNTEPTPASAPAPVESKPAPTSGPLAGDEPNPTSAPDPASTSDSGIVHPATAATEPGIDDSPATVPPSGPAKDEPPIPTEPPLSAHEQLYILLKFVEEHFKDTVEEFERIKQDGYMSFNLLWMWCTPGSMLEVKDGATGAPTGLRVASWSYGSNGRMLGVTGVKYVWDGKVFKQNHTPGLVKLDLLPIQTLSDSVRRQLTERGKLYEKFAGVHYLAYNSFITVQTFCGYSKRPAKGRVMVDTAGYYRFHLNATGRPRDMDDYSPPPPSARPRTGRRIPAKAGVFAEELEPSEPLPDEILCLTPPTHYGWSFRAKQWGLILVESLVDIVFDEMAFDQLVLKKEYKKMIKALVETHAGQEDGLAKDIIAGKGGGMVMVLHGKPGTGKTLTAEAVSEHLKCPLYTVSSGELGIQASQLEKQLKDILEMTAEWNAVVLIDEADVFLEARDTHDLARNSLVSVFLRLLEYHTG
ncbi:hypothetical protein FRC07_008250, partial [Ceratobasidium sp. 392]